jgi:signal transduction histidine kinase
VSAADRERAVDEAHDVVPLESVLCTEKLHRRARPPDYETESRVLAALAEALAEAPHAVLQTTAEHVLRALPCDSSGFSLRTDDGKRCCWSAAAGQWRPQPDGIPRDFEPCRDVLDRNTPLLFSRWERRYPELLSAASPAEEALLVPFYVAGKAVGTLWAIAHDDRRAFDAEDLRMLQSLGRLAAAAYRPERTDSRDQRRAALNLMEDAVHAQRAADAINAQLRASKAELAGELAGLRALQEVSTRMFRQDEALFAQIVDSAALIMHADMASMQVVDGAQGALRLLAFRGFEPAFGEIFALTHAKSRTPCSEAWRTANRVVVTDTEACNFLAGSEEFEQLRGMGIRAVQSTPLVSRDGAALGVISTHWREPQKPSERALHLLDALARQAADALNRNQAEEELRESEANYRAIFDGAGVALWDKDFSAVQVAVEKLRSSGVHDLRRHFEQHSDLVQEILGLIRVTDVNDECVKMFEARDKDEVLASWRETFTPESLPSFVDEIVAIADGRPLPQREVRRQTLRGRPIDLLVTMTLPLGAKQLDRVLVSALDISERRKLEQQAAEHTAALVDLDRRKDEFLAMLSHELRNPLAPITNAAQMLRFQSKTASPVERHARAIIERQTARLKHLVDELLEVSRITTGKLQLRQERVTLQGVVEAAVETARPFIDQGRHELSVNMPAELVWLDGDAARLEQVVVNLLTNAAKFTEPDGQISVTLEREVDAATLRVRDSGVGIDPKLLPRIFDLFTQADRTLDRAKGGLGIGLSLVQRIVQLHGGTVKALSTLGEGSEFVVRLPTVAPPLSEPHSPLEQLAGTARRVLVVDDNADAADTLAMLLNATRHDARPVYDGTKVLATMREYQPDVVLLDIGMPELNGYELAAHIRREPALSGVVLVAVTGYGQESDRRLSKQAGFDHHLVKPVDFPALERIIAGA